MRRKRRKKKKVEEVEEEEEERFVGWLEHFQSNIEREPGVRICRTEKTFGKGEHEELRARRNTQHAMQRNNMQRMYRKKKKKHEDRTLARCNQVNGDTGRRRILKKSITHSTTKETLYTCKQSHLGQGRREEKKEGGNDIQERREEEKNTKQKKRAWDSFNSKRSGRRFG